MTRPAPSPYFSYESGWAGATPSSGPFGAPEQLGWWFTLDVPGKLAAFAWYTDGRSPDFALFQLWDVTPSLIGQATLSAKEALRSPAGAGWRNVWCHPRPILAASTPYLVSASVADFAANFGALNAADIVSGHITVLKNGTSPQPANGVYDSVTDSGGRFSFFNPPTDGTAGHWYALDVLIEI